jgi:CheY-like chemotaxis protein
MGQEREERAPGQGEVSAPRVLIIDDEPGMVRTLRRALRAYEVETVERAQEGLELLSRGSFDAILCDLMMPEMSGIVFYERLLEVQPEMAGRVVFMSGGVFTEQAQRFVEEVSCPVLQKPFPIAELRAALAALLGR